MNLRTLVVTSALAVSASAPAYALDQPQAPGRPLALTVPVPGRGKITLGFAGPLNPLHALDPRRPRVLSIAHQGRNSARTLTMATQGASANATVESARGTDTATPATRQLSVRGAVTAGRGRASHTGGAEYESSHTTAAGARETRTARVHVDNAVARGDTGLTVASDNQLGVSEVVASKGGVRTNAIGVEHHTSGGATTLKLKAGTVGEDGSGEPHAKGIEIVRDEDGYVSTKLVTSKDDRTRVVEVGEETHRPTRRHRFRDAVLGRREPTREAFRDGLPHTSN